MSKRTTDNDVSRTDDGGGGGSSMGKKVRTESNGSSNNNTANGPLREAIAEGKKEETEEYPQGFVFAMIMTSVLSSLFLVALVTEFLIIIIMPAAGHIVPRFQD